MSAKKIKKHEIGKKYTAIKFFDSYREAVIFRNHKYAKLYIYRVEDHIDDKKVYCLAKIKK